MRYILHNVLCSARPNQLEIYTLQRFPSVQISNRNSLNQQKTRFLSQFSLCFQIWTVEERQCLFSPQIYNGKLFSSVLLELLDGEMLSITLGNEYVVGRRIYNDMF